MVSEANKLINEIYDVGGMVKAIEMGIQNENRGKS